MKEVIGDGTAIFRSGVQGRRGPDRPGDGEADRAGGSGARPERGHAGSVGEPGPAAREGEGALNENERDELNRLRKEECRAGDGARCAQALGPPLGVIPTSYLGSQEHRP